MRGVREESKDSKGATVKKNAKKKPRNYAATDTTLINLRAIKKRIAELEASVSQLQEQMARLLSRQ